MMQILRSLNQDTTTFAQNLCLKKRDAGRIRLSMICALLVVALATPAIASDDVVIFEPPPKLSFKQKHPKVYRVLRKTRTVCVFVAPIVNVTANVLTAAGVLF